MGAAARTAPCFQRTHRSLEPIDEATELGPQTAYELGAQVWADPNALSWPSFGRLRRNAINTLAAHLELLRDQGRAVRSEEPPFRYELA